MAGSKTTISSASQRANKTYLITIIIVSILGLVFIGSFVGTILFSGLIAFIFNPVYKSVLKKTRRQSIALAATFTSIILAVIVPCLLIFSVTLNQVNTLTNQIQQSGLNVDSVQTENIVDRSVERLNAVIDAFPIGDSINISKESVINFLKDLSSRLLNGLVAAIENIGGAVFGLISAVILAVFLIISMLRYQKELIKLIKDISPFDPSVTSLYLKKAELMTKAMVKGQLIIATVQGFLSAGALWLVGINYFWFFAVLLSFLSFIPLGAGIVTIPIGIIFLFTGNIPQGIFLIVFHMFGVSSVDNILRPLLVPKGAKLNSSLTLLAVFSGLAVFGGMGVIYGPVLMILIVTAVQIFAAFNSKQVRPTLPDGFKNK